MKDFCLVIWLVLVLLFASTGNLFAEVRGHSKSQMSIFNPSKVDWWVTMGDSILNGQQACEIHWLYDDSLDVALIMSDDKNLFFTFRVSPKNRSVVPPLNLQSNMAKKAILNIGGVRHPLGVEDINLPPVTVLMAVSSALNNVDYVQEANRLLLSLDGVVYNFPLENMDENIRYFKQCMNKLGIQSTLPQATSNVSNDNSVNRRQAYSNQTPSVEPVVVEQQQRQPVYAQPKPSPVSSYDSSIYGGSATQVQASPYQSIYEQGYNHKPVVQAEKPVIAERYVAPVVVESQQQQPLYEPVGNVTKAPVETVAQRVEPVVIPEPDRPAKKLNKQSDNILKDARYEGVGGAHSKSAAVTDDDSSPSSSCAADSYDEQATAILRNLLRKLKLLEKEKEELRTKLVSISSNGEIPQILECNTESLEEENSINDDIIAKFEITISSLRAENEILKEALDKVEVSEDQEGKIQELEEQLSDLVKRNHELQNDLFKYQLKAAGNTEKEESSDEETDALDDLIKHNLSDIIPNNPDTIGQ